MPEVIRAMRRCLPATLDPRAPSFDLAPLEPLRAVAEKRLAAILEAPAGFDVSGLDVRAAALPGVERHLLAVCFVLGECDRLHIDTGGGILIHFRAPPRRRDEVPESRPWPCCCHGR